MADLTPANSFDGVYQFETTDPITGGAGGIDNIPHQQLLNRTQWLWNNLVHLAGGARALMTGLLTITVAGALALRIRSGAAGSYGAMAIGRTSDEHLFGVAGATDHFLTGTLAGDMVFSSVAGTRQVFGVNGQIAFVVDASNNLVPRGDLQRNIGSASNRFATGYFGAIANGSSQMLDTSGSLVRLGFSVGWTGSALYAGTAQKVLVGAGGVALNGAAITSGFGMTSSGRGLFEAADGIDHYISILTTGVGHMVVGQNRSGSTNSVGVLTNYGYIGSLNGLPLALVAAGSRRQWFDGNGYAWLDQSPAAGDSSTRIATTAFVQAAVGSYGPGLVASFARNTPPAGWLECNGAAVSRTVYASLFASINTTWGAGDGVNTFNLPDLRGEFIRGWDNGRGVDSGRAFGSFQNYEIQSHSHSLAAQISNTDGPVQLPSWISGSGLTTGATGGSETRPRNRALLMCIKY